MQKQQTEQNIGVRYIEIDENNHNQRIDNFLIYLLKKVPKSTIYRIIRKGEVRVNKKRIKPDYKLQDGDIVRVPPITLVISEEKQLDQLVSLNKIQRLESDIIFEDEYIILVNKYSGIAVHGGSGISYGVIESLRKLRPKYKFLELVHRIDRDTSGILMIAKKRSALVNLQEQLVRKTMRKEYLALVHGNFITKVVDTNLLRYKKNDERFVKVDVEGKPSITNFKVEQKFNDYTLIRAMPVTGRTHQIRVHCLHTGNPIAGDIKYASKEQLCIDKKISLNRLFLHAHRLTFIHPKTNEKITIEAQLDNHLKQVLSGLRCN